GRHADLLGRDDNRVQSQVRHDGRTEGPSAFGTRGQQLCGRERKLARNNGCDCIQRGVLGAVGWRVLSRVLLEEGRSRAWRVMAGIVALIDYGSSNLRSAEKALARAARERATSYEIVVTADLMMIARAERIVLPGVG